MPDIRPQSFDRLSRSLQRAAGAVGDVVLDQRRKLYNAEVERQYSNATYGMNQVFDKFMTGLSENPGQYKDFMTDWTSAQQAAQESLTSQITLPEAKQKFDLQFRATEGRRRSQINTLMVNSQVAVTTSEFNAKIDDISSGTDQNNQLKVHIDAARAGGMWRKDQIDEVEDGANHRIAGNRYYAQADALAAGGTQKDVDAGVAWLASDENTPEWDDAERNTNIARFRNIWNSRLAGKERARQENGFAEATDAYDMLQRIREGDRDREGDDYPDDWAGMQERWKDANPDTLRGLLEAKEAFDRQVIVGAELEKRTAEHDQSIFELNNLERTGSLDNATLDGHKKNLSTKEHDHYADAIYDKDLDDREEEEAENIKDADNLAASILTQYELGIIETLDPRVFYNESGRFEFLERREHYADKALGIAEDKEKEAEKDEVDLLGTDPAYKLYARKNLTTNPDLSLPEIFTKLDELMGPKDGHPQISGDDIVKLKREAEHFKDQPRDKIALDMVKDHYLPLIEDAKDPVKKRELERQMADAMDATTEDNADENVDAVTATQNRIDFEKIERARNLTVNWFDKVTKFATFGQFDAAKERAKATQEEREEFIEERGDVGLKDILRVGPEAPGRPELPPFPGTLTTPVPSERPGDEWLMAELEGNPVWYNPQTQETRPRE